MVKVGNYDLKEEIGRGTFSKVRLARRISTNEQFVAKIVSRSQQNVDLDVRKEIGILRRVQHENIVKLIEILESPNNYYIILEPVLGGDLCDYIINRHSRGLPVEEVQRLYSQLISGVAMCHGVGVAHRDLKPENLLMTKDEKPVLKISDFGLSRFHRHSQHFAQPHEYAQTVTGTLAYLAPEVLNGHYDAFKADMWSLGCILFVMCTGRFPFGSATGPQLERRILEAAYDPIPEYVDPMAVDVIKRLLQLNPDARMTLPELAAHPFLMSKNQQEQYTLVEDDLATSFASPIRELYTTPIGPNPGLSESSPNPSPHMSPSHGIRREMVRNRMAELARESDGDEEPGAVSQESPKLSQVPQVPPPS